MVLELLDTDPGGVGHESDGDEEKEGKRTLRSMEIDCEADHL